VVGRTVKVHMGPFKGYRGRVVDATDSTVRIELESQMKVVTGASDPSV
jgi:transcription elongation factor SPT5